MESPNMDIATGTTDDPANIAQKSFQRITLIWKERQEAQLPLTGPLLHCSAMLWPGPHMELGR